MNPRIRTVLLLACAMTAVGLAGGPACAEMVNPKEAAVVAENHVRLILSEDGAWGASPTAHVSTVKELRRGEHLLGYYCPVEPDGYLIVSLYKDLPPVRAFSFRGMIDPASDEGTADILKARFELVERAFERALGRPILPDDDLRPYLDADSRPKWAILADPDFRPEDYRRERPLRSAGMDYQEGQTMIHTTWNQSPPYNDDCPDWGCDWTEHYDGYNTRALVGCVGIAMAQLIKYWEWPPNKFEWPDMLNTYIYYGNLTFRDENFHIATQDEIDAVADICHHAAYDVDMNFGCNRSGAYMEDCEPALEGDYDFHTGCQIKYRPDYTTLDWFNVLKDECNHNRPMGYAIPGHMICVDGWREEGVGADNYYVHVVYGWNGSNDGWWSIDAIPDGGADEEGIVCQVRPSTSIGEALSGTYDYLAGGGNYHYFNRDAGGANSIFEAGLNLQILRSGFLMSNSGTGSSDKIRIEGIPGRETKLFLNGVPGADSRIRILDGSINVLAGGQMAIY